MNFEIPKEIKEIKNEFHEFIQTRLVPIEDEIEEKKELPPDVLTEMKKKKIFGITIPREYGGMGLGTLAFTLLSEEFAYAHPGIRTMITVANSIGSKPIVLAGTEEQKKKYLPKVAAGEMVPAFGLSEPAAGSDATAIQTTAKRHHDKFIINGTKHFITNGPICDYVITFAYTDKSKGADGITCFIVDKDTEGFRVGQKQDSISSLGNLSTQSELIFEDCVVDEKQVLGKVNDGLRLALRALADGRLALAGYSIGLANRLLNLCIEYAKTRMQFGKPLSEYQAIQWWLADSYTEIYAARMLTYLGCYKRDKGERVLEEAAAAKLYATEMINRVADRAVQIFGARGLLNEAKIERIFRSVRILRIVEGTSEIQRMIIAREMLRK